MSGVKRDSASKPTTVPLRRPTMGCRTVVRPAPSTVDSSAAARAARASAATRSSAMRLRAAGDGAQRLELPRVTARPARLSSPHSVPWSVPSGRRTGTPQ
jgi:hypothetical protein